MYEDFDEKIIKEVIVLSNLNNVGNDSFSGYFNTWRMEWQKEKEYPNKSKEEIEAEINEEKKEKMNNLIKESIECCRVGNDKKKELEKVFKQMKLKINFNSQPRILRDGKFYTISKKNNRNKI